MQKQTFVQRRLQMLALMSLSASLVFSCTSLQAQDSNSQPKKLDSTQTNQSQLTRQNAFVSSDPGISIAVRKVQFNQNASDRSRVPIMLIHGGGPGILTSFDLAVGSYSIAADLATAGHPVYLMNVRRWENSTRPAVLNQPPQQNPPAVTSEEAVRDIHAVVRWIQQQQQDRSGRDVDHSGRDTLLVFRPTRTGTRSLPENSAVFFELAKG